MQQPLAQRIEAIITPSVEALGYEIVRVRTIGTPKRQIVQIMADRLDGGRIGLDECADVSRTISALLDVENVIASAYELEVSSPGLERPLVKQRDFERFAGKEAQLETQLPVNGRKRFCGTLKGVADGAVLLEMPEGTEAIALENVSSASLVMSDEALKADLRASATKKAKEATE